MSSQVFSSFCETNPYPIEYFSFANQLEPPKYPLKQGKYSRTGYAAKLYHAIMKASLFTETTRHLSSNIIFGGSVERSVQRNLQAHQRLTHFENTFSLGSKAGYHKLMKKLAETTGEWPSFYSESYLLPEEDAEARRVFPTSKLWIRKPAGGARGDGISVIDSFPNYAGHKIVVQKYIDRPLLIHGLKFDLRFYVAVASLDPIRIYVHENGLVRLATEPYDDNFDNLSNRSAHLTNFSINKSNANFHATEDMSQDGTGNKWTHKPLWPFLASQGFDPEKIKNDIDDAFVAVIASARDTFMEQTNHRICFEMFGFDVMLDETGKIYILEVNVTPAMGTSSGLDLHVKAPVLTDLFNMALIPSEGYATNKVWQLFFERDDPEAADYAIVAEYEQSLSRCGGFRCIYPTVERLNSHSKLFPHPTEADQTLARWIQFSDAEKQEFLSSHFDAFMKYVTSD